MRCWQHLGEKADHLWENLRHSDPLCLGAGKGGRASGGLPFFLCSALLGLHLFPSTAPPPPALPTLRPALRLRNGGAPRFSRDFRVDLAMLRQQTLAAHAAWAAPVRQAQHAHLLLPSTHPLVEDILCASARGRRVTAVLRVLEGRTAAARARARARAAALVHPDQLTFP